MAQPPRKASIFSLETLGSALGGALFFEDPPDSDESDQGTPPADKTPVFVPPPPSASANAGKDAMATGGGKSPGTVSSSTSNSNSSSSNSSSSSKSDDSRGGSNSDSSSSSSTSTGAEQSTPGKGYLGSLGGAVGYVVPTFGLMSPKKSWPMPQKRPMPRQRGERPVAGRTCADFLRAGPTHEYHTWYSVDANTFSLRVGPNYDKNKSKGPSADALYDLVGLDIYKTSSKIDNIGSKVAIPPEWMVPTPHDKVPPVFIVQNQMPEVSMIGLPSFLTDITDGPGWAIAVYYRIKPSTVAAMQDLATAPGGVRLFYDFCCNAPEQEGNPKSPYRGRFKVCPRIDNIEELSLPYLISSYNSKPALIVKTGSVHRGDGYIEVDVNVHQFGTAGRTALQVLRFDNMTANFGFCFESRDDGEMPEVLFGTVCLNHTLLNIADEWVH